MTTLADKGFLATEEDVAKVAQSVLNAIADADNGRRTYLKVLIATTQNELGSKPRVRAGKTAKLDAAGVAEQIKALDAVHERFYAVVLKVVGDSVPTGTKERALEINRRSNFARTAMYVVRGWVRAGNDLTTLGVQSVTKSSLFIKRKSKPPSGRVLKARAEKESKSLVGTLMALADADKEAAVEELQLIMGQVASQLVALGVAATKDAAQSLAEHRPLRIGKMLFAPTDTQIVRSQARPS